MANSEFQPGALGGTSGGTRDAAVLAMAGPEAQALVAGGVSGGNTAAITTALAELVAIVDRLRDPVGGCPWDLEQTHRSLIPYVLEEAHEVADAIRQGDPEQLQDELGDLLLQVVLHARIASEAGQFDLAAIARGISAKLVRRHPHVFAGAAAADSAAVRRIWEAVKAEERAQRQRRTISSATITGDADVRPTPRSHSDDEDSNPAGSSDGNTKDDRAKTSGIVDFNDDFDDAASNTNTGSDTETEFGIGGFDETSNDTRLTHNTDGDRDVEHNNQDNSGADANQPVTQTADSSDNTPQPRSPLSERLAAKARGQSALAGAMAISRQAAAAGFEWDDLDGVWAKVHEELDELKEAVALAWSEGGIAAGSPGRAPASGVSAARAHAETELGDVLFTLVNVGRWCRLDPEEGLAGTNRRFLDRFSRLEAALGGDLSGRSISELEQHWQQAKAAIRAERGEP